MGVSNISGRCLTPNWSAAWMMTTIVDADSLGSSAHNSNQVLFRTPATHMYMC